MPSEIHSLPHAGRPLRTDKCLLCGAKDCVETYRDRYRPYLRCPACGLIFVPREHHISANEAKRRYDLHRNDPGDEGYRSYLRPLVDSVARRLSRRSCGLDFGCGPGPALAAMLAEHGHTTVNYDPVYSPDISLLNRRYDFVVCSEVVEHLAAPAEAFDLFARLLEPGGTLGIMTQMTDGIADYSRWRYMKDETHIAFYSVAAFTYAARRWRMALTIHPPSVAIFSPASPTRTEGRNAPLPGNG